MNGACNARLFFAPAPWGPCEGSKGQISFNFNYKVNFKDFYTKLCVCSHKWKIQNISDEIFILSPGSCPRGGTLGRWGCPGDQKKIISNMAMWYIKLTKMTSKTECKYNFHPRVKLVTLGWGQRSNIIKFRLPCQFQRFLYQILCVFSQMKKAKHRLDFHSVAWVMPQGWDFGALGVPRGSNNFFSNMVM